jgi:branched-chain amino acid transport system permease protein
LFFYLFVSLRAFGGDEGLSLTDLSDFGMLTGNKYAIYISLFVAVLLALWLVSRIVSSRFGLVLKATRFNPRRVNAVGTSSRPYQLVAYVISAQICAVAGYFMANLNGFVSPAMLSWLVSAELMVMVLLGGMGTLFGPIAGAIGLLLIEDALKMLTVHWPLVLGPLILLFVLKMRQGIWGVLLPPDEKARQSGDHH